VGAFALATLALLLASLVGVRSLTITLSALGVGVAVLGQVASWRKPRPADRVWLPLGGFASAAVLALTLFAPGLLNGFWALDVPIPPRDANKLMRAPRDQTGVEETPLAAGDWVDATTEAIRQDDLLIRVEKTWSGPLEDKGPTSYLLVYFRLVNHGSGQSIPFEGFGTDKHRPVLTDDLGHSYPFLEQRPRKLNVRGAIFEAAVSPAGLVLQRGKLDSLLVFQVPASPSDTLKLELPASAWGRQGVCKMRLTVSQPDP